MLSLNLNNKRKGTSLHLEKTKEMLVKVTAYMGFFSLKILDITLNWLAYVVKS